MATCDLPVDCGNPFNPDNGQYTAVGTYSGDTANLTCDDGYDDPVTTTITCEQTGNWDAVLFCTANSCTPTQVTNSNMSATGSVTGTTGQSVAITCDDGYM